MRDTNERLRNIQEAISNITKYTHQGRERFDQDELVRGWVILQLGIIGEAARAIPLDFKDQHPEILWTQIDRVRDTLVYIYFDIDIDIVWSVVEADLPILKASVEAILNEKESHDQ
ncbi:MAG: HepT-like ribonuclease domain-containing protein [Ktedonobacteraceae bacterium]